MHPGAETSSPLRFSYLHINDITWLIINLILSWLKNSHILKINMCKSSKRFQTSLSLSNGCTSHDPVRGMAWIKQIVGVTSQILKQGENEFPFFQKWEPIKTFLNEVLCIILVLDNCVITMMFMWTTLKYSKTLNLTPLVTIQYKINKKNLN
jgi:hypothetical protein